MSSVPKLTITYQGVTIPQAVDIRTGVMADYNFAFGGNLNITSTATPQAHISDNLTQNISDANAAIAEVIAGVDPATSDGRMQDGIGRIYFIGRKGATASVVQATVTGQPGAILPAGSLARDVNGQYWASSGAVTFPGTGVTSVQFACTAPGPVQLGIGELNRIAQASLGWDAINNTGAAVTGTNTESRAEFEARRFASVAANGSGSAASIRGAVWEVEGVLDVYAYDNRLSTPITIGSTAFSVPGHCVYVAVVGGSDEEVATAIYQRKNGGCNLTGNTSVDVVDDASGVALPYPVYQIQFERPAAAPVKFLVQIKASTALPSDIVQLTKQSVMDTFNGVNDYASRARVGGLIFASSYYAGIASISSSVLILSVKVGDVTADADSLEIGVDQVPTLVDADIEVQLI